MDVKALAVPVYANYTAEPYAADTVKALLTKQVSTRCAGSRPWKKLLADGVDTFIEVGAGKRSAA